MLFPGSLLSACIVRCSFFCAIFLFRIILKTKKANLARIQDLVDSLQSEAKSYEEKLSEQRELLANSLFARLLNHSLNWNETISGVLKEADFPVDTDRYVIFLVSVAPAANSQGNDEPLSVLEPLAFQNSIRQLLSAEGYPGYVILSGGYFIGMASLRSENSLPDFEKLQNLIPHESAVTFSVAVSGIHKAMNELPLAYSEALRLRIICF